MTKRESLRSMTDEQLLDFISASLKRTDALMARKQAAMHESREAFSAVMLALRDEDFLRIEAKAILAQRAYKREKEKERMKR